MIVMPVIPTGWNDGGGYGVMTVMLTGWDNGGG